MYNSFRIPKLISMIKKFQEKNTDEQLNRIIVYIQKNICSHGIYGETIDNWKICSGCGRKVKDE